MSGRDTQFAGFAHLLNIEVSNLLIERMGNAEGQGDAEAVELLIARRAYDLAQHVTGYNLEYLEECGKNAPALSARMVDAVPDLTAFPGEG